MDWLTLPPGLTLILAGLWTVLTWCGGHLVSQRQAQALLRQAEGVHDKAIADALEVGSKIYQGIIATQKTDNDALRERLAAQDARIEIAQQAAQHAIEDASLAKAGMQQCLEREAGYQQRIATLEAVVRGLGGTV